MTSIDALLFPVLLLLPICLFYLIFRRNWVDVELRNAFVTGLLFGGAAILITRLSYVPIEMYLGTDLRTFISGPRTWWITLLTSVGVIGIVEEGLKSGAGLLASYQISFLKRPAAIFMAFAGTALAFSLLENIQYYLLFGAGIVLPRIVISSSAHLFFSCVSSAVAAVALSRSTRTASAVSLRILLGVLIAALIHGLFDFLVFHFDIQAASGVIVSLVVLFFFGVQEAWIVVLRVDEPPEVGLRICAGCGAFSIERSRFCGFCGSRVLRKQRDFTLKVSES
ncbi:MAG: PrsW family intramembrane metalloprotease [Candidatus Riflebacteria bacterium]|nr:PrsW family intramembrane metalloprotease [Candidatus Riflebacteria bacterium]